MKIDYMCVSLDNSPNNGVVVQIGKNDNRVSNYLSTSTYLSYITVIRPETMDFVIERGVGYKAR